jgi:hypothetical protein
MLSFSISYWHLTKTPYFVDTTERGGDRGWKRAQRQGEDRVTFQITCMSNFSFNLTKKRDMKLLLLLKWAIFHPLMCWWVLILLSPDEGPSYFIIWSYRGDELLSHACSMKLVFKLTWHYHVRQIAITTNIMLVPLSFRFKLLMTYVLMEGDSSKYHACSMKLGFKLSMTFIIRWDDTLKIWYVFHEELGFKLSMTT